MTDHSEIARSPADVLRGVVATAVLAVFLVVEALFGRAIVSFTSDALAGLDAVATSLVTACVIAVRSATFVLLAGALVTGIATRRWRAVVTGAVAAIVGAGLFVLVEQWIDSRGPAPLTIDDLAGPLTSNNISTTVALAATAAILTAAAPWLSRRTRRIGWALVAATTIGRFLAAPVSGLATAALLCGWVGGAIVLVGLGGPIRRPTTPDVIAGLREVGLDVGTLEPASVDARGSTPYLGRTSAGGALFVKVLGRDERGADLLFRLYRWVRRLNQGDERPFASLQHAVEHEAVSSLMARTIGIRTPAVLALATAEPAGVALAYEGIDGRSLDRVDPTELTDETLADIWQQVATLRRHRIAHRDLRLANLFLGADGTVWLIDFGFARLAAPDDVLTGDLAEVGTALALLVGPDRAVSSGQAALGADAMAEAAERAPKGLSTATRTALQDHPDLLPALREVAARRITPAGGRPPGEADGSSVHAGELA